MANEVNLGRLGFVIKGTATPNTQFKRLDVVDDGDGNVYVSLKDQTLRSLSDLKPGSNWYRWIKSNEGSLEPVANAVSEGIIFVKTDDSSWGTIGTITNNGETIKGRYETLIIPNNIKFGETARGLMFKVKNNCKFIKINNNTAQNINYIIPTNDIFLQNDIWILYITYKNDNELEYELVRIYREPKIVNCECFATTELKQSGTNLTESRITLHPMGEIGKMQEGITYQFRCRVIDYGISFGRNVKKKTGTNSYGQVTSFTNKTDELFLTKDLRIAPAIFSSMKANDGYDYSNYISVETGDPTVLYQLGRIDFKNPAIPIKFPQLYGRGEDKINGKKFGNLTNLNVPINETFTMVLVPYLKHDGTVGKFTGDCSWYILVYFDNIDKIIECSRGGDDNIPEVDNLPADSDWTSYDFNGDGKVDVEDVNICINMILRSADRTGNRSEHKTKSGGKTLYYIPTDKWNEILALSSNEHIDVETVNAIINKILGLPLSQGGDDVTNEYVGSDTISGITLGDVNLNNKIDNSDVTAFVYIMQGIFNITINGETFDLGDNINDIMGPTNYYLVKAALDYGIDGTLDEKIQNMIDYIFEGSHTENELPEVKKLLCSLISITMDINCDGVVDKSDYGYIVDYLDGDTSTNVGKKIKINIDKDNNITTSIAPKNNIYSGYMNYHSNPAVLNKLPETYYEKTNITIIQNLARR